MRAAGTRDEGCQWAHKPPSSGTARSLPYKVLFYTNIEVLP